MLRNSKYYKLLFVALMSVISLQIANASDDKNLRADDLHGAFHVSGAIFRDACRLDMDSAYQEVFLGNSKTSQLSNPGDRGQNVTVKLRLKDCQKVSNNSQFNEQTALMSWSESQPFVSVRFIAVGHKDNAKLVAVNGIEGIGLRITDKQQRDIDLGERGAPLFLEPGENALIYHVATERTRSPLEANAWDAFVGYELIYD